MEIKSSENQMNFFDSILPALAKSIALSTKVLGALWVLLAPIRETLIAVITITLLDLVTGVWAAKKRNERITSSKMKKSVAKLILYGLSVLVGWLLEQYLMPGFPVVRVISGLVGIIEGKSFFENVHRITGTDFWAEVLNKMQSDTDKEIPEEEPEETPPKQSKKRKKNKK